MADLDTPKQFISLDPDNVLDSTARYADQCQQAWKESRAVSYNDALGKARNIVVCGMGGSRFTPRAVHELYRDSIRVPYEVVDGYEVPGYVGKDTLVILSSYSGTTEEVVSCGEDAIKRGAQVTAVTRGGKLKGLLDAQKSAGYYFDPIHNPSNQPRIGGGYLFMGHLGLLQALGYLTVPEKDVRDAIEQARSSAAANDPEVHTAKNPAKQLAQTLQETHPFIITAEHLRGFANGFANQINETAKMISDYRYIPELNHHLMEGLKHPNTLHETGLFLFIESDLYSDRIQKRFRITKDVVEKQKVKVDTVKLLGATRLGQVLEAFVLSSYTTFYMAMLSDINPVEIPWVDHFKAELAK